MFLTTTGTNVVIVELGITIVHPTTDFAILSQFAPEEIGTATSLTTAILAGTLIWRKVAAGVDQVPADYDPDYADVANESSGTGAQGDRALNYAQALALLALKANLDGGNVFVNGSQVISAINAASLALRVDQGHTILGTAIGTIPPAPLNLVNSVAAALRTQLSLVNTGGAGAGNAIDFYTYDLGFTIPGSRISALDNNFSADFAFLTKIPGAGGNALAERLRLTNDGRLGVGTNNPSTSALVEMASTTRGFLPPRMTTAQRNAIAAPATGLVVYNTTTSELQVFSGTWFDLTSSLQLITTAVLTSSSNTILTNITGLQFNVTAGKTYRFETHILHQSTATTTGLALSIGATSAVGTLAALASILTGGDGTAAVTSGAITAFSDTVIGLATPVANLTYASTMFGTFICTTSGVVFPQFRSEINNTVVSVRIGSSIVVREF